MMQTLSTLKTIPKIDEDKFTSIFGMIIVIASLSMLFVALIVCYSILRVRSGFWVNLNIEGSYLFIAYFNTVMILISSFTYFKWSKSIRNNSKDIPLKWINTTILIGLIFLLIQLNLWYSLSNSGLQLTTSQASAVFYLLSGLHGLHIIAGIIALVWIKRKVQVLDINFTHVRITGMFWHFLSVVWIAIFISVILI
jgi:heme/copper-type cytochrome/quinol oxidase subunit 3